MRTLEKVRLLLESFSFTTVARTFSCFSTPVNIRMLPGKTSRSKLFSWLTSSGVVIFETRTCSNAWTITPSSPAMLSLAAKKDDKEPGNKRNIDDIREAILFIPHWWCFHFRDFTFSHNQAVVYPWEYWNIGPVGSTPAWDGTGCEFDSWQCRIYIPCSLSLRLFGSLRGSLVTYGLTQNKKNVYIYSWQRNFPVNLTCC